jgi:diketogulonate reductase-like aldo/keto reductase
VAQPLAVDQLHELAVARGAAVAQVAIASALTRGDDIVPLVGARRRTRLEESLSAVDLTLDDDELKTIETAIPEGAAAGERHDAHQMSVLDSEKISETRDPVGDEPVADLEHR